MVTNIEDGTFIWLQYDNIFITEQVGLWFMVFNATFNNISVILWQSVLLLEETRVPRENYQSATSH
jgi:hypothetical protein